MSVDADFAGIRALIGELREDLVEHRGDVATKFARIEGALDVLATVKTAEHQRIDTAISDLRHDHKATNRSALQLHDRLDEYPRPEEVKATAALLAQYPRPSELATTAALAQQNRSRMDRLLSVGVGVAIGSSLGGSAITVAILQMLEKLGG